MILCQLEVWFECDTVKCYTQTLLLCRPPRRTPGAEVLIRDSANEEWLETERIEPSWRLNVERSLSSLFLIVNDVLVVLLVSHILVSSRNYMRSRNREDRLFRALLPVPKLQQSVRVLFYNLIFFYYSRRNARTDRRADQDYSLSWRRSKMGINPGYDELLYSLKWRCSTMPTPWNSSLFLPSLFRAPSYHPASIIFRNPLTH